MKKIFFAIAAFAALLSFTNCNKETVVSEKNNDTVVISQLSADFAEIQSEDPDTKSLFFANGSFKWNTRENMLVKYRVNNGNWSEPVFFSYSSSTGVFTTSSPIALKINDHVDWIAAYNSPKPSDIPFEYSFIPRDVRNNGNAATSGDTNLGLNTPLYGTASTVGGEIPSMRMKHLVAMLKINITNNRGTRITFDKVQVRLQTATDGWDLKASGYLKMNYDDLNNVTFSYPTQTVGSFDPASVLNSSINIILPTARPIELEPNTTYTAYTPIVPQTVPVGSKITLEVIKENASVIPDKTISLTEDLTLTKGVIKTINYSVR